MPGKEPVNASAEDFEIIKKNMMIPTIDLLIEFPQGILLARRKIEPYLGKWALPGLRIRKHHKLDGADSVLRQITRAEVGVDLATDENNRVKRQYVDNYIGTFSTRQDFSTGFVVQPVSDEVRINPDHFSSYIFVNSAAEIPKNTGAMYRHYLEQYFSEGV